MQEMQFQWPDGSVNIHAELLKPVAFEKIVIIAGPDGPNPKYVQGELIDSLLAHNIAVLTYDERGCGNSTGNFSSAGYFDLAADLTLIARNLRRSFGLGVVIGVAGISDGGWKALIASNYDKRIEFLTLIGTPGMNGLQWVEAQIRSDHRSWRLKKETPEKTIEYYQEIHRILSTRRKPETQLSELNSYLESIPVLKKRYKMITSPLFRNKLTFMPAQYAGQNMPPMLALIQKDNQHDMVEWESLTGKSFQTSIQTMPSLFAGETNEKIAEPVLQEIISWLSTLKTRELN